MAASSTPGAITLFRVAGIPIQFHFTFLLLAAIFVFGGFVGKREAVLDAALLTAVFASVLLHELGHALTALRFGVRIVSITMYPIGGVARMASQPGPWQELWITAAGPAVNLVLAAVFFGVAALPGVAGDARTLLFEIAAANVALLLFNLIPAFPMDGGRLLRSLLALRKPERDATRIATVVGRAIAILMAAYAIYSGQYLLLFIAFIVFSGAQSEQAAADAKRFAGRVPVSAAMTRDVRTLDHASTMDDAIRLARETPALDFPVMYGERVVGLLRRDALQDRATHADGTVLVAGAMNRDFVSVSPDMDLAEALPLMQRVGGSALVLDEGRLAGMLTIEGVRQFFALHAAQSR